MRRSERFKLRRKRKKLIKICLLSILAIGVIVFSAIQVGQSDKDTRTTSLEAAKKALEHEEYEKSIDLFHKILKEDKSLTGARVGLAKAYMGLERFDKAIATLKKGIEIEPKESQFYYFLSVAHEGLNELPQVIQTLEDGIKATDNTKLQKSINQLESNINIAPDRHYVQKGHSRNIVLEWEKTDGSILPVEAEWKLENEDYGSLVEESETVMTFQAKELGTVELSAKVGSITKEAELHIEEQVVEEMTFKPEGIDPLSLHQELQLTVAGFDADGEEMEINPEWSSSDEEIIALSPQEGNEVTAKAAMNEGVSTITVNYQDLEEKLDFFVDGNNKFVKAEVEGEGTVSISPEKTSYPAGTDITLKATPEAGYKFVRWEGAITETNNPLEITLETSISVVAIFEPADQTLNLSISGEGNIIRNTLENQFAHGEAITLFAEPKSGWEFSHWEGSVNHNAGRITVVMDSSKDIQAVFKKINDSISNPSSSDNGPGKSNPNNKTNKKESSNSNSSNHTNPPSEPVEKDNNQKPENKEENKAVEKEEPTEKPKEEPKPEEKPEPEPEPNEENKEETEPSTGNEEKDKDVIEPPADEPLEDVEEDSGE
ncbi:tetratricopeptide repeat protein [Oceanobacillus sp. Castelsardo]|uniref:InlB B-repeat-containing protein n=1 Tax=Oceanobacillus sp. Castelsardo TaxID=1851204 RepID=UPI000839563D|nr:tetratricopeptide repeat protein [Oceanobacillus sp. Castelsardo]